VWDDIIDTCRRFRPQLAGVHIKGWNAAYGRMPPRYSQGFCAIGEGDAEVAAVLKELAGSQYGDPWVIVEQDYARNPEHAIRLAADTLVGWGYALRGHGKLSPQPTSVPAQPDQELASLELHLRHRLEGVCDTDLDKCYCAGLTEVCTALSMTGAVLSGLSDVLDLSRSRDSDAVEYMSTVLAVVPPTKIDGCSWNLEEGEAIREPVPVERPDNISDGEWALWQAGSRWRTEIHNPFNLNQNRYHLSLYGNPTGSVTQAKLRIAAECLGRFLDQRLNEACTLAGGRVALLAASANRLDDFVEKLREEIRDRCHCEQAVLFVADQSGMKLVPIADGGALEWTASIKTPNERCYSVVQDKNSWTVKVFKSRLPLRVLENASHWTGMCFIRLTRKDASGHIFTLAAPMIDAFGKPAGVVRCANRLCEHAKIRMFHDDDLALLDAMIQSALPRLNTLRGEWSQRNQLRKVTHELKRPLMVIRAAVDSIQKEWNIRARRFHAAGFEDLPLPWFDDVQSWCGIMRLQLLNPDYLTVEAKRIQLNITEVSFLPDVLAPIVRWMAGELEVRHLPIRRSTPPGGEEFTISQGVHALPKLWVDRNMFQQIFFNLLDNAIKYAKPNQPDAFSIEVRSESDLNKFFIRVRDWGIGVEDVDNLDLLFEDGVRGENAWRHDLNGTGYGLWVVRRLVVLHSGTIAITRRKDPTEFTLTFPGSLRSKSWYAAQQREIKYT
jgi:signal transduction histidine kinase